MYIHSVQEIQAFPPAEPERLRWADPIAHDLDSRTHDRRARARETNGGQEATKLEEEILFTLLILIPCLQTKPIGAVVGHEPIGRPASFQGG